MECKDAKKKKWLLIILIVENSILLLAAVLFGMRGCVKFWGNMLSTNEIYPLYFHHMHVHTYPDKLTYVIGRDNRLDLSGGQVCFSIDPKDLHGFPCEWDPDGSCEAVYDMEEFYPEEFDYEFLMPDLDFSKEGIYNVVLMGESGMLCSFPIQVISPDYVE